MGKASCPTCQTSNFVEAEVMFNKPVFYFQCNKCDTLYAENPDGEWIESEPYREYIKNLIPSQRPTKVSMENRQIGEALYKWRQSDSYKTPDSIHWLVWLVENPKSPVCLAGATDLYTHDCIHIVLNKLGMDNVSESYVIGFTMGNSAKAHHDWRFRAFLWIALNLYPKGYRFDGHCEHAFYSGWDKGYSKFKKDICKFPFMYSQDLNNLRKLWALNVMD